MYTVTRQCQFPDGDYVVEISAGGIDFTNPGELVKSMMESLTNSPIRKRL